MSDANKVIWSEGMFLLPQHLQQQDRYVESLVDMRCLGIRPFSWGFSSLSVDNSLLKIGKVALTGCSGVFPDGTPFKLPDNGSLPLPLDVPEDVQNEMLYLALPLHQPGSVEADSEDRPELLARFRRMERDVKDNNCGAEGVAPLQVGNLKTALLMQRQERSAYACLGIGRILEARKNQGVILDEQYIPPNMNCLGMPNLAGLMQELHGLLNSRGEMLAGRINAPDYGGVAQISDFMLLQLINRYQPLIKHFATLRGLHPDDLFRFLIQLAGELATFYHEGKRADPYPEYDHENLQNTFFPLMEAIRRLLIRKTVEQVVQLPLTKPKYGIYGARLPDINLLDDAFFVLAAKAEVQGEKLRTHFPPQVKIGPAEEIQNLVRSHLPGIPIEPLPAVPRQLPFHAGFIYFQLDKNCTLWKKLTTSVGFAIYIGGNFPGLQLEFWAIRGG
ncbi:MAG: type VI secretion system baseplate subunit TssK [Desulfosarcina sp.]